MTRVSASKAHGQDLLSSKLPCPDQPHQWDTFRRDSTPWFSLSGIRSQPRLTIVPVNCTPRVLSGGAGAAATTIFCPHTRCKLGVNRPHKRGAELANECATDKPTKRCALFDSRTVLLLQRRHGCHRERSGDNLGCLCPWSSKHTFLAGAPAWAWRTSGRNAGHTVRTQPDQAPQIGEGTVGRFVGVTRSKDSTYGVQPPGTRKMRSKTFPW